MVQPIEVLAAMITPAVLISAAALVLLSTANRLGRLNDRLESLVKEAERLGADATGEASKRQLVLTKLSSLLERVLLLRSSHHRHLCNDRSVGSDQHCSRDARDLSENLSAADVGGLARRSSISVQHCAARSGGGDRGPSDAGRDRIRTRIARESGGLILLQNHRRLVAMQL